MAQPWSKNACKPQANNAQNRMLARFKPNSTCSRCANVLRPFPEAGLHQLLTFESGILQRMYLLLQVRKPQGR